MKELLEGIRTLIMLAILVVLPGIALLGKHCPQVYDVLGRLPAIVHQARVKLAHALDPHSAVAADSRPAPAAENWTMGPRGLVDAQASQIPAAAPRVGVQQRTVDRFPALAPSVQPSPASGQAAPPAAAPAGASMMEQIEARLRELGAVHFRLERWDGGRGEVYRFECQMSVGGDPRLARHFEATADEVDRAAQQVLEQVEAWHHAGG
jgi:hypothetical protein